MNEKNTPVNNNVEVDVSEVKKVRIEKLNDLVQRDMNPFEITSYNRTHTAGAILGVIAIAIKLKPKLSLSIVSEKMVVLIALIKAITSAQKTILVVLIFLLCIMQS